MDMFEFEIILKKSMQRKDYYFSQYESLHILLENLFTESINF
jgi:hypothetical protein